MRMTELHCKEVICINDGRRLGYVSDLEICIPDGHIAALIVPGPYKFLGCVGRNDDFIIPWNCIKRIGPDIILVDTKPEDCRRPRPRPIMAHSEDH